MTYPADGRPAIRLPHGDPPEDTGHRIATIRRGERAELRASLVEGRDGEPFVRLRAWQVPDGRDAGLWPVPGKAISIRLEEAGIPARPWPATPGPCSIAGRRDWTRSGRRRGASSLGAGACEQPEGAP